MSRPSIGEMTAPLDAGQRDAVDERRGFGRGLPAPARDFGDQRVEACAVAELDAGRVAPLRLIKVARQRDVCDCAHRAAPAMRLCGRRRICVDRHVRIGGDRDERGIGAVLQEPPHQISEQIAMAADRRIDAAGRVGQFREQRGVERLAHAVAGAGTRSPSTPPASSMTLATVSALWVANCG